MSSLTQALSVALSGLQTSTALIANASNNISNAQTAGFTAKSATVTSVAYGGFDGGSTIASYTRAADTALTDNYNSATSQASYSGTLNTYMTQVQTILGSTSTNPPLSNDVAQFAAAWSAYSAEPESSIQAQTLLSTGQTVAQDIKTAASQVATLDSQVQSDTATTVTSLNSELNQVATLNSQIQLVSGSNSSATVNLQDQRDAVVNQISQLVSVNVQNRPNGQIALYTTSGQLLVDSGSALNFSYNSGTSKIVDANGTDVTAAMSGGTLQAQLNFRDSSASAAASSTPGTGVIAKLRAQLSTLVDSLTNTSTSQFATAYSAAATASTAAGATQSGATVNSNFFSVTLNGNTPDPSTFQVNPNLVAGTSAVPQTGATAVANSFTSTANYSTSGLNANGVTYSDLAASILSSFQQTANTISTQSTSLTSQQTYFQTALSSKTGVNIDTELANLVAYQNSYAASAHVISTVNQMLTDLMSVIGG